ncbi:Stk1 family PASTA domain-containing Ser/Thr kinase [Enemella sp. A6]|uniref:Stk1 family PASTA domain-containing Ser/Thr kinase n=1 Tax=Enemella sp. A6 TaxID=3440152 RepID=UPI003EBB5270
MTLTSMRDPLVGHALEGRYEITDRLARGGMATVYRAHDNRLGRIVAVKVMHEGLGDDQDFGRKFDREARAAARLSHPNVVSVFDQGRDHGRPYIVMEYVPGSTLRSMIVRDAPLEAPRALDIIEPVLAALAAAHEAGLVHRDVKPENVLISDRGQLKVADFGLAKAISGQTATATQGLLIGTVSYLPPELVTIGKADTRSDVYSAGVVLWEMLTGRKPHTGDTPIQVAYAHVHNDIPPVSDFLPGSERALFPDYLDALVAGAVRRDPARRPVDAAHFLTNVRLARSALADGVTSSPTLVRKFTSDTPSHNHLALVGDDDHAGPDDEATITTVTRLPVHQPAPVMPSAPSAGSSPSPQEYSEYTPTDLRPVPPQVYRRRRGLLLLILLLVLGLVGGVGGWWLMAGRWTDTPALAGLTREDAISAATAADLEVTFDEAHSETVAAGRVIDTDPAAGARVTRGSSMEVALSLGPERFEVPKLVGMSVGEATEALRRVNLVVGETKEVWHEEVPAGVVVGASMDAGSQAKRGDKVDLTVSKGRQPITVPKVAGKSQADAQAAIKKAGLTAEVKQAHSASVPKGVVISQAPADGTLYRGDRVSITVSKGPVMVQVPNVKSMGVQAATKVLQDKGFKVTTRPVEENYLGLGYVAYTDPGIGSSAPKGSTITLYLV